MNGMSEKDERDKNNNDAARILARRMAAKDRYRRNRDAKFADWLGRDFEMEIEHWKTPTCSGIQRLMLVGYDPKTHIVHMKVGNNGVVAWDTDDFWALVNAKKVKHA